MREESEERGLRGEREEWIECENKVTVLNGVKDKIVF